MIALSVVHKSATEAALTAGTTPAAVGTDLNTAATCGMVIPKVMLASVADYDTNGGEGYDYGSLY